jgi:hypothetical protein
MRADNLALAERLKFVQGYQSGSGSGVRRNAAAQGGAPAVGDVEAGTIVSKYMQQYEQSINPFAGAPRLFFILFAASSLQPRALSADTSLSGRRQRARCYAWCGYASGAS